ncbi:hypothetical protein EW146_g5350 [Bondarzewia mesenterica]|uniref:Uncharacterized protein n=1 Tax=Bondarzewia mesenterica TaxID=1095465 RepID=A0A4S4LXK3_9AGAM|nr:hypothetical protein EW146_g5350 [Bondarzewia mesenterica]
MQARYLQIQSALPPSIVGSSQLTAPLASFKQSPLPTPPASTRNLLEENPVSLREDAMPSLAKQQDSLLGLVLGGLFLISSIDRIKHFLRDAHASNSPFIKETFEGISLNNMEELSTELEKAGIRIYSVRHTRIWCQGPLRHHKRGDKALDTAIRIYVEVFHNLSVDMVDSEGEMSGEQTADGGLMQIKPSTEPIIIPIGLHQSC